MTAPIRLPNPMMADDSLGWIGQLLVETQAAQVPGDVVECGCHNGLTSLYLQTVIAAMDLDINLWCYDAFAPVDGLASIESEAGHPGFSASNRERFEALFSRWNVKRPFLIEGLFSRTLPGELPPLICFALIDCDYYEPMKQCLTHVLPRVGNGGMIALHDYHHHKWGEGVKRAVAETWKGDVAYDKGIAVLIKR